MTMQPLEVGDQVRLKSGGPVMTVSKVHDVAKVTCDWFDEDKGVQSHIFPVKTLERVG